MRQTTPFYSLLFQIVTNPFSYNIGMNILTVFPWKGFLLVALLFTICFVGVHLLIFARIGWEFQRQKPEDKPEEKPKEEEKQPPQEREPIYYIVERKTKRAKKSYGEPKQINFKP